MQFQQSQFTRSTQFTLREHGFFVSQRDGRGQVDIAVEIPYEELLPVRLEYRRAVPGHPLHWIGLGLYGFYVAVAALSAWPLALAAAGLLVALFLYYAWNNWWHQAILHTGRLQLVLADHPRDRRQFRAFAENLDAHTKTYLRREYADINPLGIIEPQLRRVAWLRELGVLSASEARTLNTRLTGRLSERRLRSMGQRLEALYVN